MKRARNLALKNIKIGMKGKVNTMKECKTCQDKSNPDAAVVCQSCGAALVSKEELDRKIQMLQNDLVKEIAGENTDINLSSGLIGNQSGYTDDDLSPEPGCWGASVPGEIAGENCVQEAGNAFQPPATRKVLSGHSEEDVVIKYRDLLENIIFELKNKSFVLFGGEWTRRMVTNSERDWMSEDLLRVIEAIERNGSEKVSTPSDDYSWWAILKEVIKRLEAEKITAPVQMIKQNLYILDGRVKSLLFVMPSKK